MLDPDRVAGLDQRVVVGHEVEGIHVLAATGADGGPDGTDVIAEVRGAGGGDAGKDAGGHGSDAWVKTASLLYSPLAANGPALTPATGDPGCRPGCRFPCRSIWPACAAP